MFCALTRWQMWRAMDEKRPLTGRACRHLERCAACREERARSRVLADRLRLAADAAERPAPVARPLRGRRAWSAAAVTALAAASVAIVVNVGDSPQETAPAPVERPRLSEHLREAQALKNRASQLLFDNSLDRSLSRSINRELANLTQDARHGLHYVLRVGGLDQPARRRSGERPTLERERGDGADTTSLAPLDVATPGRTGSDRGP